MFFLCLFLHFFSAYPQCILSAVTVRDHNFQIFTICFCFMVMSPIMWCLVTLQSDIFFTGRQKTVNVKFVFYFVLGLCFYFLYFTLLDGLIFYLQNQRKKTDYVFFCSEKIVLTKDHFCPIVINCTISIC